MSFDFYYLLHHMSSITISVIIQPYFIYHIFSMSAICYPPIQVYLATLPAFPLSTPLLFINNLQKRNVLNDYIIKQKFLLLLLPLTNIMHSNYSNNLWNYIRYTNNNKNDYNVRKKNNIFHIFLFFFFCVFMQIIQCIIA